MNYVPHFIKLLSQLTMQVPYLGAVLFPAYVSDASAEYYFQMTFLVSLVVGGLDQYILSKDLRYKSLVVWKYGSVQYIPSWIALWTMPIFVCVIFYTEAFTDLDLNIYDYISILICTCIIAISEIARKNQMLYRQQIIYFIILPCTYVSFVFILGGEFLPYFISVVISVSILCLWLGKTHNQSFTLPIVELNKRGISRRTYFLAASLFIVLLPQIPIFLGMAQILEDSTAEKLLAFKLAGFISLPLAAMNLRFAARIIMLDISSSHALRFLIKYTRNIYMVTLSIFLLSVLPVTVFFMFLGIEDAILVYVLIASAQVLSARFGPSFLLFLHFVNARYFGFYCLIIAIILVIGQMSDGASFVQMAIESAVLIIVSNAIAYTLFKKCTNSRGYLLGG